MPMVHARLSWLELCVARASVELEEKPAPMMRTCTKGVGYQDFAWGCGLWPRVVVWGCVHVSRSSGLITDIPTQTPMS